MKRLSITSFKIYVATLYIHLIQRDLKAVWRLSMPPRTKKGGYLSHNRGWDISDL